MLILSCPSRPPHGPVNLFKSNRLQAVQQRCLRHYMAVWPQVALKGQSAMHVYLVKLTRLEAIKIHPCCALAKEDTCKLVEAVEGHFKKHTLELGWLSSSFLVSRRMTAQPPPPPTCRPGKAYSNVDPLHAH